MVRSSLVPLVLVTAMVLLLHKLQYPMLSLHSCDRF